MPGVDPEPVAGLRGLKVETCNCTVHVDEEGCILSFAKWVLKIIDERDRNWVALREARRQLAEAKEKLCAE